MIRIVPAIDLIDGACVRLYQGDYSKKTVYGNDPVEMAKAFEAEGAEYLHLVDLDGARTGKVANAGILEKICKQTALKVDFGGGIQAAEDLRVAFDAGAVQVNVGSAAVKEPERFMAWLEAFGAERIILSADVREGKVMVRGWQESSSLSIEALIEQFLPAGLAYLTCTDISRDGAMTGPNTNLYASLCHQYPGLFITASGGIHAVTDLPALEATGVKAAITGRALYEGAFTLSQAIATVSASI